MKHTGLDHLKYQPSGTFPRCILPAHAGAWQAMPFRPCRSGLPRTWGGGELTASHSGSRPSGPHRDRQTR